MFGITYIGEHINQDNKKKLTGATNVTGHTIILCWWRPWYVIYFNMISLYTFHDIILWDKFVLIEIITNFFFKYFLMFWCKCVSFAAIVCIFFKISIVPFFSKMQQLCYTKCIYFLCCSTIALLKCIFFIIVLLFTIVSVLKIQSLAIIKRFPLWWSKHQIIYWWDNFCLTIKTKYEGTVVHPSNPCTNESNLIHTPWHLPACVAW